MSEVKPLEEVVRRLEDTFNDPQTRESSYLEFYDDSLIIHGFPPDPPTDTCKILDYIQYPKILV